MKNGFTLVELLIVATIMAILAGIGVTSYNSLSKQSRDARRKSDLQSIRSALEFYRSDNDYYPTDLSPIVPSKYLNSVPLDPKHKTEYLYCPITGTPAQVINYDLCANLENTSSTASCCNSNTCPGGTCNYKLNPMGEQ